MKKIFEPVYLKGMRLNNRIIRSATHENLADEFGLPTEKLIKKYEALAKGEVGAIITGYMGISQQGKSPLGNMLMIDKDEQIEHLRSLTDRIHLLKTPIIAQIAHCGGQTKQKITGEVVVAPSEISDYQARALSSQEIEEIIQSFVQAITRVKKSGFDGVQLHLAHGYLLSEFLSPRMNRRTDQWGGSTENRCRIVIEIIKQARGYVGDFPILVKMNGHEQIKDGILIEEGMQIAKLLEKAGCDAIEVSTGMMRGGLDTIRGNVPAEVVFAKHETLKKLPKFMKTAGVKVAKRLTPQPKPFMLYNVDCAALIKNEVDIPVIVVGGITKLEEMETILDENKGDFISMARPFVIEPTLVRKIKEGKQANSKCIQCNYCVVGVEYEPLHCYFGRLPK